MTLVPLTSDCNQNCVFCSGEGRENLHETGLKDWLKHVLYTKDSLVQISGGEPLLCPFEDILKFIHYCARHNNVVEFQTNGTLFPALDDSQSKALVRMVMSTGGYFNVNFSSHNEKLDRKITGTYKGFIRRQEGVRKLLNLRASVRLTHVIFSFNYKYLRKFVEYVSKEFPDISWIQFSFIKAVGRAKKNKKLVPLYSKVVPYLNDALEFAKKAGIRCEVDHIPLCFIKRFWKQHVDVHKMLEKKEGPYVDEKIKIQKCKKCKFFNVCSGPRIDYLQIYGEDYAILPCFGKTPKGDF